MFVCGMSLGFAAWPGLSECHVSFTLCHLFVHGGEICFHQKVEAMNGGEQAGS